MNAREIQTFFRSSEETFPTVKALLNRVYAQTIDFNEFLNTLQMFGFSRPLFDSSQRQV